MAEAQHERAWPRRRWTEQETERLCEMVAAGATRADVARVLGRDHSVICQVARRLRLDWPTTPRSPRTPRAEDLPAGSAKRELFAALEAWTEHLRLSGLAASSVKTYRNRISRTFRDVEVDCTASQLRESALARVGPRGTPQERSEFYLAIRAFFTWWGQRGGPGSPLDGIRKPRYIRTRRRGMTRGELELMLERLAAAEPREKALGCLLTFQGLRIGEVGALEVRDFDLAARQLRLRHGKGGTDRTVPMGPTVPEVVQAWVRSGHVTGWLFPQRRDPARHMTEMGLRGAWRRMIGPELAHLLPHMQRHSFADSLRKAGVHTSHIGQLLGHSSLQTTERYLSADPDAQRAAIEALDTSFTLAGAVPSPALVPVAGPQDDAPAGLAVFLEAGGAALFISCELNPSELAGELQLLLQRDPTTAGLAQAFIEEVLASGIDPWKLSTRPPAFRGSAVVVDEANMTIGVIPAGASAALRTWSFAEFADLDWASKPLIGNLFDPGFQLRHYGVDPIWTN